MKPFSVQLIINGEKRDSSTGDVFYTYHPGTQEHTGTVQSASSEDIQQAAEVANAAFSAWEKVLGNIKRNILNKAADLLESEKYARLFAETLPNEIGCAAATAAIEPHLAARQLREAAAQATQIVGETFPSERVPGATVLIQRRAHGVILAIVPWNSPVNLAARAVAIPLICGNTVVMKTSEACPRTHQLFAEALHEAGLPHGVLNLIHVSSQSAPKIMAELVANPHIRHVNFTGGDRVGRILAAEAGKHLKPCIMELGGKAAVVVLKDANVKLAARAIISGAMLNSGQICMSTERIIVQREVAEVLIAEVTALAKKLKAGSNGHISGVFTKASAERIISLIKGANSEGAEILVGDVKSEGPIVQPHVLLGYKPEMRIWWEEAFGPVVGFTVCDTVDEAIELANKTPFSLTSSLWTNNINGIEIASRMKFGSVMINGSTVHAEPQIEIHAVGGNSGYGRFDIENFTQRRIIIIHPEDPKFPLVDDIGL